ncbi:hypothetical protein P0G10_08920 [Eubacteriales bacterium DFI.9.88]|nr:hypothetical protein [Eubacteriales bacterium DFI.9.88]
MQQDITLYAKRIEEDQALSSTAGSPSQDSTEQRRAVSATGDARTDLWIPICLLTLSGLVLICLYRFTKRRRKNH